MYQTLYVLVYPSRLFAAHWSFWIPHLDSGGQESSTGDRIHVTGDCLNGFEYEYVCDYNVDQDDRKPIAFPIGLVLVSDTTNTGIDQKRDLIKSKESVTQKVTWNRFDDACRQVSAPGPSLNKVVESDARMPGGAPPRKSEVKDCQWWIKKAASHLWEIKMLLPLDDANQAEDPVVKVYALPKH
jgi:hypothetical protein